MKPGALRVCALGCATALLAAGGSAGAVQAAVLERVSVATGGAQAAGTSFAPSLSGDGRFVAFTSSASNLVAGDTNATSDVFVRDRQSGTTERVSIATGGGQSNGGSSSPAITPDGRIVAFLSSATNLVAGDTNNNPDVFVHDRQTGTTERASLTSTGGQISGGTFAAPTISADGRIVGFWTGSANVVPQITNVWTDVFVRDRVAGTTELISGAMGGAEGDSTSSLNIVSADGRYVAFQSQASNLVPGDTNGQPDAFLRDRVAGTTRRVSIANDGTQPNSGSIPTAISADGRYVVFHGFSSNLVPNDTNGRVDVFVYDRVASSLQRVSVAADGAQGNDDSDNAALSADGRFVVFTSAASNLVPNDTNFRPDIIVRDRTAGLTWRASVTAAGTQASDRSSEADVSADGRHIGFSSEATNLAAGDTNMARDAFVRDAGPAETHLAPYQQARLEQSACPDLIGTSSGSGGSASPSGQVSANAQAASTVPVAVPLTPLTPCGLGVARAGASAEILHQIPVTGGGSYIVSVVVDIASASATAVSSPPLPPLTGAASAVAVVAHISFFPNCPSGSTCAPVLAAPFAYVASSGGPAPPTQVTLTATFAATAPSGTISVDVGLVAEATVYGAGNASASGSGSLARIVATPL
jgi:Tol biopolymer transport system component